MHTIDRSLLLPILSHNFAPPKQAGEITLVYSLVDGHLKAWTYNPGQRRVRRNPNFEYDNPIPGFQGLMTIDATNGFVGAADRYNWKLLGKKELYIPYNVHDFFDPDLDQQDFIQIVVNTIGTLFDTRYGPTEVRNEASEWNQEYRIATRVEPQHWVLEMEIPARSLELDDLGQVEAMGFNFARVRMGPGSEHCQWMPTYGFSLRPEHFGVMLLD